MEQQKQIEKAIKHYMQSDLLQLKLLGSGANGSVFGVNCKRSLLRSLLK